ncbi:hypothetical protein HDU92_002457 [Lobulomyces angularis]|nr:hypothetical protein HDU92_002457 [Lobulomyces angularis]
MKTALALTALTALTSAASVPVTGDLPPKGSITVNTISYAGSGCPAGTVSENLNSDATAFTLLFDSYVASKGPSVPITENRKNCQLNINLNIPQGWQYSVGTVDYRGFMQLDAGVTAQQQALYYFQGELVQQRITTTFSDKNNGDYTIRDAFPLETTIWSSCTAKANVNINTQIRLSGPNDKQGLITIDSVDAKVTQIYGLQWKKC